MAISREQPLRPYVQALGDAIDSYDIISAGAVEAFGTVAQMQAATYLTAGMVCHTNGFHSEGDGGAAYYTIGTTGTANDMDVLALQNNLLATLAITEPYVTPEQFGAYGDGTHDDTASMKRLFSYYASHGCAVSMTPTKTYIVNDGIIYTPTMELPSLIIYGNGATISYPNTETRTEIIPIFRVSADLYVENLNMVAELTQSGAGAAGGTIVGRSFAAAFIVMNDHSARLVGCKFDGFDTVLGGLVYSGTPIGITSFVSRCTILNTLYGISQFHKKSYVSDCTFSLNPNAERGEHCIYYISDTLQEAIVDSCTFIGNSKCTSCVQAAKTAQTQYSPIFMVSNCSFYSVAYIATTVDVECIVSNCVFKCSDAQNPNSTPMFFVMGKNSFDGCDIEIAKTLSVDSVNFSNCRIYNLYTGQERVSGNFDNCILVDCCLGVANAFNCLFKYTRAIPARILISGASGKKCSLINCVWDCTNSDAVYIFYNSNAGTEFVSIVNLLILNPTATFGTTNTAKIYFENVQQVAPVWTT